MHALESLVCSFVPLSCCHASYYHPNAPIPLGPSTHPGLIRFQMCMLRCDSSMLATSFCFSVVKLCRGIHM